MANTFTQLHIQAIFAVQNRDCIIGKEWKEELHKYLTGIVQNHGHNLAASNLRHLGKDSFLIYI